MLKLNVTVNILRTVQQAFFPDKIFNSSRPQLMCAKLYINRHFFVSANQLCDSRITNTAAVAKEKSYSIPLKVLKIAIIGVPNSGKSTLINGVLNRRVSESQNNICQCITSLILPCGKL
jgi:ribosome biogenesis GTPase A